MPESIMNPPPMIARKPRASLPSHLSNGNAHAAKEGSPLGRTSVNAKERNSLTASIRSSHTRRQPIDLDLGNGSPKNGHVSYPPAAVGGDAESPTDINISARDARDKAFEPSVPNTSRPEGPYTQNPPIDFDGLSWPSELQCVIGKGGWS